MKERFKSLCQSLHAALVAPRREHVQYALAFFGVGLISLAYVSGAYADEPEANWERMDTAIKIVLDLIEGRFGVIIMLCAGIGAIISSAFGQYRAALSLLVVALGAFILRTIITIFFNTEDIEGLQG